MLKRKIIKTFVAIAFRDNGRRKISKMLKVDSTLHFIAIVTAYSFIMIFGNFIFKVVNKIVGSNFVTPLLSIFLEFINIIGENSDIRLGTADSNIKFVSIHVRLGISIANNFLNGRTLQFI